MKKQIFTTIVCLCVLALTFSLAQAIDVHFQWGASTGQVDGYRIYWSDTQNDPYPNQLCEVNGTTLDCITSLDETQEYYLVCRAFNVYGESENSNELHWLYAVPGNPGTFSFSVNLVELLKSIGADRIQFVSEP